MPTTDLYTSETPHSTVSTNGVENQTSTNQADIDWAGLERAYLPSPEQVEADRINERLKLRTDYGVENSNQFQFTSPVEDFTALYNVNRKGQTVPKYESFIAGTDNNERLAREQTTGQKLWRGSEKFIKKVPTYAVGNTAGFLYGIGSALVNWDKDKVFNNSLIQWVDDITRDIEDKNPLYLTQAYRDANFFQRTADVPTFLTSDLRQGVEFLAGTVLPEIIKGAITGGSSLLTSAPLTFLKAAGRGVGKKILREGAEKIAEGVIKNSAKNFSTEVRGVNSFMRTLGNSAKEIASSAAKKTYDDVVRKATATEFLNTIEFTARNAHFEASIEGISNYNEMISNFILDIQEKENRLPTPDELAAFDEAARKGWQRTFGTNLAYSAVSNAFTLGGMLGYTNYISKFGSAAIRKVAGRKVGDALIDNAGKITHAAKGTGAVKKVAGNVWHVAGVPTLQGAEEVFQSIVSNASSKFVQSKYDSLATGEAMSTLKAYSEAFTESIGDKDVWTEFGVGAIIGGISGAAGAFREEGWKGLSPMAYSAKLKAENLKLDKASTELTDVRSSLIKQGAVATPSQMRTVNRFKTLISRTALGREAIKEADKGNLAGAALMNDISLHEYYTTMKDLGLEDQVEGNVHEMIDRISHEDIEALGVDPGDVKQYKDFLKGETKSQIDRTQWAYKVSETLVPALTNKELKGLALVGHTRKDLVSLTAMELSLGVNAETNAYNALYDLMDELGMTDSAAGLSTREKAKQLASTLDEVRFKTIDTYTRLDKEEQDLIRERDTLYSITQAEKAKGRAVTEEGVQAEAPKNAQRMLEITTRLAEIAEEKRRLEAAYQESRNKLSPAQKYGAPDEADLEGFASSLSADAELKDLFDTTMRQLEDAVTNKEVKVDDEIKNKLDRAKALYTEYTQQMKAHKTFMGNFALRTSKDYAYSSFSKLIPKALHKLARPIEDEGLEFFGESFKNDRNYISLEQYIAANANKLSDAEKANLRILHRIIFNQQSLGEVVKPAYVVDPISDVEFTAYKMSGYTEFLPFAQGIIYRKMNGIELSPNQTAVFDRHRNELEKMIAFEKGERGDTIDTTLVKEMPVGLDTTKSFKEALAELITKIINANTLLEKRILTPIDKNTIPKPTDYDDFAWLAGQYNSLERKNKDGTITDEEQFLLDSYYDLKAKIDNWGLLVGAQTPADMKLSNLIQIYVALDAAGVETDAATADVQTPDTIKDIEWFGKPGKRRMDIGQIYDTAVVSKKRAKNGDVQYTLHNISIDRILELVGGITSIDSVSVVKKQEVLKPITEYNSKTKKIHQSLSNQHIRVSFEDGSTVDFTHDFHGNVVLTLPVSNATTLGNLVFMPVSSLQHAYQPLLFKTDADELIIVQSDYTFESGSRTTDSNAAKNAKEGDRLRLIVERKDGFNQKLLAQYRKLIGREGKEKELATIRKKLEDQILVYLVNSKGSIVQVLKSNPLHKSEIGAVGESELKLLRKQIVESILADEEQAATTGVPSPSTFDTGLSVIVDGVMPALPNVEVVLNEAENYVIKQNDFDDRMTDNVIDIGYMLDGEYFTRNGVKINTVGKPYMQTYLKDKKFKGQRIPFVVFKDHGKLVVYPVSAKETIADYTERLDEILNLFPTGTETQNIQRANALNQFILEYGLNLDKLGFTDTDATDDTKILRLIDAAGAVVVRPKIKEWTSGVELISDILKRDATIDVDISDNPFLAPKLLLNLKSPVNEPASEAPDIQVSTNLIGKSPAPENIPAHLKSPIYKEALEYFKGDTAKAMVVFNTSFSRGFIQWAMNHDLIPIGKGITIDTFFSTYSEENLIAYIGRHFTLDDIMRFWEMSSVNPKGMDSNQRTKLINLWGASSFDSMIEFAGALRKAFFDGSIFRVDPDRITPLGVFSEADILDLRTNSAAQGDLMSLLWQLNYDASHLSPSLEALSHPTMLLESTYSLLSDLMEAGLYATQQGAMRDVEQTLASSLGGVPEESMLEAVLNLGDEFEGLKNRAYDDDGFLRYLSRKYSNMHPIPVKEVTADGTVMNSTSALTAQNVTGVLSAKGVELRQKIYNLIDAINRNNRQIDDSEGFYDSENVKIAIQLIEEYAAEAGVDIIGLHSVDSIKSDAIVELLQATGALLRGDGNPTADVVNRFVSAYNEAFDMGSQNKFFYSSVDTNGKALVRIDGKVDEEALLRQGYIRVGANLFHKIAPSEFALSTDELYNKILDKIKGAEIEFITEAMIPSVYTNGLLDINKLTDQALQNTIKKELRNYVLDNLNRNITDKTLAEKEAINRIRFGDEQYDATPSISDFSAYYLTAHAANTNNTETIQNIWGLVLREKIKNSPLYQNSLQYFTNINGTLIFDTENEVAKTILFSELRKQGMIDAVTKLAFETNNQSLLDIVGKPEVSLVTTESTRAYYSMYPMTLKEYTGKIYSFEGVMSAKSKEQFIRVKNRVFEGIRNVAGSAKIFSPIQMGVYSPIQPVEGMNTVITGQEIEYSRVIDLKAKINGNLKQTQEKLNEINNCL